MTLFWGAVAVLVMWAGLSYWRRRGESLTDPHRRGATSTESSRQAGYDDDDDAIDFETLNAAEQDIRDVDVFQQPEDGFTGDDWGPGASKGPRMG